MMEFHVSRRVRDRYRLKHALFSFSGNVVFADLAASRDLAHRMNQVRGVERDPSRAIRPGALYAMGLIDELGHALVAKFRAEVDPEAIRAALSWFDEQLGAAAVEGTLLAFVERFPGIGVYRGAQSGRRWLEGETAGVAHREVAFEEMMMLWLANANPAFSPFSELFADGDLARASSYREITTRLREFFATRPRIGPEGLSLIDMLRAPALASPDSLAGQLAVIQAKWSAVLGPLDRILLAVDVLKEEDVALWMLFHPPSAEAMARPHGAGGASSEAPSYSGAAQEYERFSPDQEWMPTTVLLAKSTYVWLEQLSEQYGRKINRLDQIPGEELELMCRRGLNALWLIGIWERSRASQTIKQLCGNKEAVASAYSLDGYGIAADLGGEDAYRNLRDRAAAHGIRLASDMVPNHMGIDSGWVIQHPEWFISRPDSPFPAYRFEGPNLSYDGRVEIKIEDHYYEQTDAAVVFRRRDMLTGETRYVYHGNDGTSFPWNDTAQLDYLNPSAREQVIQTILHVARLFPIIRFDAAMTLAKRHFERLWYPLPGTGGAIPSRAESGLSKAQFDAAMPEEFWREVVDRVAREVPGTLLLAEAFWLMEGYFVRTLGMHRVYNSAFMNMLRDEENAKYLAVIKNTMEFDPDILKRYVNFMSNPDERTAIDQFGREDKYFGVATLMATLPGLPMFGHGQIEGFTEKYGMEFRRARYREHPDQWLLERHEREIAPLLHRRALFAESGNFLLYDFYRPDGSVDENVFAYSNRRGEERALVIYHNRYATTHGAIHHSAPYADKAAGGLKRRSIGDSFSLSGADSAVMAFRDAATGLQHLEKASAIAARGLSFHLHAYQRHVFVDWRELRPDGDHRWGGLSDFLNGRGVESLDEALICFELRPVHEALAAFLNPDCIHFVAQFPSGRAQAPAVQASRSHSKDRVRHLEQHGRRFLVEAVHAYSKSILGAPCDAASIDELWEALRDKIQSAIDLLFLEANLSSPWSVDARAVLPSASPAVSAPALWGPVLAWCAIQALGESIRCAAVPDPRSQPLDVFNRLRLREALAQAFGQLGLQEDDRWRAAARVRLALMDGKDAGKAVGKTKKIVGIPEQIWDDPDGRWLLGVHEAAGPRGMAHTYFNKELHARTLWWLHLPALIETARASGAIPVAASANRKGGAKVRPSSAPTQIRDLKRIESAVQKALAEANRAGYRLDGLFAVRARKAPQSGKLAVPRRKKSARKPTVE